MFASAIAMLLLLPQGTSLVTYQQPAARLETLLPQLSKQAGVSLEASASLRDEVFLLRVKDLPVERLMKELADATSATWEKTNEGYKLVPDSAKQRAEIAKEVAIRQERLDVGLKEELASLAAKPAYDPLDAAKKHNAMVERIMAGERGFQGLPDSPSARAITDVLALIGAEKLAQATPGKTVVYATPHTRAQVAATPAITAIARKFATQVVAFRDAQQKGKGSDTQFIFSTGGGANADVGELSKGIGKVMLKTKVNADLSAILCTLTVFDSEGYIIATGTHQLALKAPAKVADPTLNAAEFKPSALAREFAEKQSTGGGGSNILMVRMTTGGRATQMRASDSPGGPEPSSAALIAFLRSPDRNEPLALGPGELLSHLYQDRNLVALIGDGQLEPINLRIARGPFTGRKDAESLLAASGLIESVADGVTRLRPVLGSVERQARLNRNVLTVETRQLAANGFLPLDNAARLLLTGSKTEQLGGVGRSVLLALNQGEYSRVFGDGSMSGIRLYGHLPKPIFQSLMAGQTLAVNRMTPQQVRTLLDLLLEPGISPGTLGMVMRTRLAGGMPEKKRPDLWSEPTERYAGGLPSNGFLKLNVQPEDSVWVFNRWGQRSLASIGTVGYALTKNKYSQETFAPAKALEYQFQLNDPSGTLSELRANDIASPAGLVAGPYASLPEGMRKQIDEAGRVFGNIPMTGSRQIKP